MILFGIGIQGQCETVEDCQAMEAALKTFVATLKPPTIIDAASINYTGSSDIKNAPVNSDSVLKTKGVK